MFTIDQIILETSRRFYVGYSSPSRIDSARATHLMKILHSVRVVRRIDCWAVSGKATFVFLYHYLQLIQMVSGGTESKLSLYS
jgi:hypothetical protein